MKTNSLIKFAASLMLCCMFFGCTPEDEMEKLGTIYGTVTDFASGEPIGNANVRLNPRGETTLTGMDGTFEFVDLPSGSYSLSLSKNGYVDLDDDYVIKIENGNNVQRAIQLQKLQYSLQIVDNDGNVVSVLDFGIEADVTQKTFNIFNNGNMAMDYAITKTANWIEEVTPSTGRINMGDAQAVSVRINRGLLADGGNSSSLVVTATNLGGVEVAVKATKPVLPSVETNDVTNVTPNSASCGGNVISDGGVAITSRGVCYSKTSNPTISDLLVNGGTGTESFTCSLTELEQNTTYYVRAYATNSVGTAYGVQKSFTTNGRPSVSTVSCSNVSVNSASCSGNVSSNGGAPVTERGICYGLTPNPSINNNIITSGTGIGSFTCDLTNLTNNTTYYVKAYAKNSYGVAYGEEKSFTTEILPTFQYSGHTYYVAPEPDILRSWSDANSYCDNLTIYGLSGWKLPTRDELEQMYSERYSIGDFFYQYYTTSIEYYKGSYWSSTTSSRGHCAIYFYYGSLMDYSDETVCRIRPIRIKD